MSMDPSPNGDNGDRDASGRFRPGWRGGPGNPHARRVADIRATLLEEVSDDDLRGLIRVLIQRGLNGDVAAAREVLDRMMGKSRATLAVEVDPHEGKTKEELLARLKVLMQESPEVKKIAAEIFGAAALPPLLPGPAGP